METCQRCPKQEYAQKLLNECVEDKLNDKTPTDLKILTFHQACDKWLYRFKKLLSLTYLQSKLKSIKLNISNVI